MTDRADRAAHNDVQLAHYAGAGLVSPRMQPVDTPYVRRHVERLVDELGLRPGERVLDVGCGLGKFTRILRDVHDLQVEGLDLSPALLEAFASRDPEVPLHHGDLLDPPAALRDGYDAVTGFFMLHHLPDLVAAFRGVRSLLRPGGRAGFVEPNAACPLFWAQITATPGMTWRAERGVLRMTRPRLTGALVEAGFEQVAHHRTGMLPPALFNRPGGPQREQRIDGVAVLEPVRAFVVVSGRRPATA